MRILAVSAAVLACAAIAAAQGTGMDWRHIGNAAIDLALPSVATGPVDRVWYSADGSTLFAHTLTGKVFKTNDFEQWQRVTGQVIVPPPVEPGPVTSVPEANLALRGQADGSTRVYAVGRNAFRSDDGGLSWTNLTAYKGVSILGGWLSDAVPSPRDPNEITVAASNGIWRSMDGGLSWSGLNQFLPNLPAGRLMGVPNGTRGVRLALEGGMAELEWAPGEKTAWRPVDVLDVQRERDQKAALAIELKRNVTAVATSKDYIYAGDSEGRMLVSSDAGKTWGTALKQSEGAVEAIWVDGNDPRVAVAAFAAHPAATPNQPKPVFVAKTMNGGIFWDDISTNLPDNATAHGVTADRATGAVYLATDAGVFYGTADLASAGRGAAWSSLSANLPAAAATDVRLDAGANQLYVALDGYGVYAAIAPHRVRDVRVVNAADYSARPAAPGALLSVLGTRLDAAHSADTVVPVLAASDTASQIQVPFEVQGNTVSLSLDAAAGRFTLGLPLQNVSPAIFVDPEGTPLIMDASSGVLLDRTKPAHANSRIQILATGLGRVKPDWPTGLAAPLNDPPQVIATVHASLDRVPVEVVQAVLAPGYVGFYLIEIQLPRILNTGAAELVLEAEGQQSNHVRLYVEP